MAELSARTLLEGNKLFTEFKGALSEQYVSRSSSQNLALLHIIGLQRMPLQRLISFFRLMTK